VGYIFPVAISPEFRMEQYRDDDHREGAPHFIPTLDVAEFMTTQDPRVREDEDFRLGSSGTRIPAPEDRDEDVSFPKVLGHLRTSTSRGGLMLIDLRIHYQF